MKPHYIHDAAPVLVRPGVYRCVVRCIHGDGSLALGAVQTYELDAASEAELHTRLAGIAKGYDDAKKARAAAAAVASASLAGLVGRRIDATAPTVRTVPEG